jgi:hypothetical protein
MTDKEINTKMNETGKTKSQVLQENIDAMKKERAELLKIKQQMEDDFFDEICGYFDRN